MENSTLPITKAGMEQLVRGMKLLVTCYQAVVPEELQHGMMVSINTKRGMDAYFAANGEPEHEWPDVIHVDGRLDIDGDYINLPTVILDGDGKVNRRFDMEVEINDNRWS